MTERVKKQAFFILTCDYEAYDRELKPTQA